TVADTPAGISVLIPGVTVPWEAIFGLVVLAIVHEMAHGVLCYVEKLPLKSSGVVLFGFLPVGAFVEPDEKRLDKLTLEKKRRILVAGSASNALFFVIFFVLASLLSLFIPALVSGVQVASVPANSTLSSSLTGFSLLSLEGKPVRTLSEAYEGIGADFNPQALYGKDGKKVQAPLLDLVINSVNKTAPSASVLSKGDRIAAVDGVQVFLPGQVGKQLAKNKAGDAVILTTQSGNRTVLLDRSGKIGITVAMAPSVVLENLPKPGLGFLYSAVAFLLVLFSFAYLLNLLIAIVNLLPIFVTDGQKMVFYELEPWLKKDRAMKASMVIGFAVLGILLINALPYFWH
ncbi:MAG TPA: site-2 protease family protein, partial [Candidatus Norongarragalinales archaeon]|nr:site-2 protease family protein [Candidatus Norongarragalinales archaeon]